MVAAAIGGVAWVFLYPILSGERKAEQRARELRRAPSRSRGAPTRRRRARAASRSRRRSRNSRIASKKAKHVAARPPGSRRPGCPGRSSSSSSFPLVLGVSLFLVGAVHRRRPVAAGDGVRLCRRASACRSGCSAFSRSGARRKFLDNFPDAVDIIVRGIKAGLPLLDSSSRSSPLTPRSRSRANSARSSRRRPSACRSATPAPSSTNACRLPEANFFGIVISIQQKAGGNLSEALGNLSRVLRDRKKMKAKIQAMSMEAKASAGDHRRAADRRHGALVYLTSPDYIAAALDAPTRPIHAGRLRGLDGDRRLRHEENDQFRLLRRTPCSISSSTRCTIRRSPDDALRCDRRGGDGAHAGHAAAVARHARASA